MTSTNSEPTYLVRVAQLLLDDAARAGASRDAILRGLGLDPKIFADPDARLPLATVAAIARAVVASAHGPAFGLRAGAARDVKDAGLIGYLMQHSATLRDALGRLARYGRIMADHNHIEVDETATSATIVFDGHPVLEAIQELTELDVAWIVGGIRKMTSVDVTPLEVRFPFADPAHVAEMRGFFRCPLQFMSPHVAVVLKSSDLALAIEASDPTLAGYLVRLAEDAVKALGEDDTTTGRLRQVLWTRLTDGAPTLATAAAAMAVSERTLQRRLSEEGTNFAEALSQLRQDLAVRLLEDRTLAVYEIAFLLGYAEPTAFHRAFRRWRGMSPRHYREQAATRSEVPAGVPPVANQ
jgi:AraC-like DNA-binding protein